MGPCEQTKVVQGEGVFLGGLVGVRVKARNHRVIRVGTLSLAGSGRGRKGQIIKKIERPPVGRASAGDRQNGGG